MIDELRSMAIFAETVRQGSFRAAAKALSLSPSVVSYHITQLESRVGNALIYRTTRKLSLTHEGDTLYKYVQDMLSSAQIGLNQVSAQGEDASGRLRVTLPSNAAHSDLGRKLAEFCKLYPAIDMQISYTAERRDLIAESIDLAIRVGELNDSTLKCKRIGQIERRLVCSREYYEQFSVPKTPDDLADWQWIRMDVLPPYRTLISPNGEEVKLAFKSRVSVNSLEAMTEMCIMGLGLCSPPAHLVEEAIKDGRLVEVIPDWRVEPISLYAVWPNNATANSNTHRLLKYLTDQE